MDVSVLTFIVDCSSTTCRRLLRGSRSLNRDDIKVLLVAVLADVTDLSGSCDRCLRDSSHSIFLITGSQMPLVLVQFVLEKGRVATLLHELLRRLCVYIHCSHLCGGLLSSGLVLFFLAFLSLDALKFVKDVLIMQESVGELIQKVLVSKEALNTTFKYGHLE